MLWPIPRATNWTWVSSGSCRAGFKKVQRVIAVRDLDGVPAGTEGRILLANGFNWLR